MARKAKEKPDKINSFGLTPSSSSKLGTETSTPPMPGMAESSSHAGAVIPSFPDYSTQSHMGTQPMAQTTQPMMQSHMGTQPMTQSHMGTQPMTQSHMGTQPMAQTTQPMTQSHMAAQPSMPIGQPNYAPYPVMPQMAQMMQMMQMMMGVNMGVPGMDPSAQPFQSGESMQEPDAGIEADIIRPHHLRSVVKKQEALSVNSLLDCLCLTEDGQNALGGIPKGCTIALVGPPGKGKTRTAIAALCKLASVGMKCAFVVAEEGFIDSTNSGRDDLCSRLTKIGMKELELSEAQFQKNVAPNIAVIQSQYHKGQTWDSFVSRYRFLVEKDGIEFVIIDSLNMLDPAKTKTADNLSALKTYNHEKGVTCLTLGQIRDTGAPVGGEALIHTADAVFLLEEMGLNSKEMAQFWGGEYRDQITVLRAIKSVTTPIFPYPIRIQHDPESGVLQVHPAQPERYKLLSPVKTV